MARLTTNILGILAAAISAMAIASNAAHAQILTDKPPEEAVGGVGVDEKLGERVPSRLEFTDSSGKRVPLAKWIDGEKPVVLALGYYRCPVVCPTIIRHMTLSFQKLDYTIGEDFNVVIVSVDPQEQPTHANNEKLKALGNYGRDGEAVAEGWGFLTGEPEQIAALADAVGYRFKKLESGEYSHPVVLSVLSPEGKITRYIYGFSYPPRQVKLSLLDASDGTISKSLGDAVLHFCYRFDPAEGSYTIAAFQIMRIAGVLTIIVVAVGLMVGFGWEKRRREKRARDIDLIARGEINADGDDLPRGAARVAGHG